MSIYEKRSVISPSFFQKIFKIVPKINFLIELENLLAENENNIFSVNPADVENLKIKYKIKDGNFKAERQTLLEKYLVFCVSDNRLSDDEKKRLSFLCRLLGLDDDYLSSRISDFGASIYRDRVQGMISDDVFADSEREELKTLRAEFNLTDENGKDIYSEECKKKIQAYVDKLVEKRRMSPDEEKTLNDMISGLGIDTHFTDAGLSKLRHFWEIESGKLVPIDTPVNLQKNECLYYASKIEWYEERSRTTYVSYGGLTTNFRICKGVSLRAGNIAPARHSEEYMKLIDSGDVYFTNKRIVFTGTHGNKTIPWSKILDFTPYADGVEIGKDTGKKPFFKCSDVETMGLFIARLLKDF